MVKTPKMRPSQSARNQMTIEGNAEAPPAVAGAPEMETGPADDWHLAEDAGFAATPGDPDPLPVDASREENRATVGYPDDSDVPPPPPFSDPLPPHENGFPDNLDPSAPSTSPASERNLEPTLAAPPRPARGASMLGAGVVGGIVALAGATALQFGGWLPSPGGSAPAGIQDVRTELSALQQDVAALQGSSAAATDAAARVGELSTSLDQVKTDIANLPAGTAPANPGSDPALGALGDRLAAVETAVQNLGTPRAQPPSADLTALGERLARVEALAKTASQATGEGEGKLAALDQSLATFGQSIAALQQKVESQASQPKIAMSIAASGLKTALDRGGSFETELEAFAAVAPEAPELASLRSLAAKGVATVNELQAQTRTAVDTMLAADRPTAANAGFFDRLLDSAGNMVTIRPVGPVEGAGAPETAARMEAALGDGDLAKALAEYDTMPEPAKSAGASFAQQIRDRLEAERLADVLIAGALKAA